MLAVKKLIPYFLITILSLPTFISLLRPGYFPMHDDLQIMRLYQMDKCVKDFQIPCRWSPDMGYGYGYPQFNYYAPLPYYLAELFHLVGFNLFAAIKATFILSLVLGNYFMFLLLKKYFSFWPSLLGTVLYAYLPYRASDIFARGALNESWAFVFMPVIILGIVKIIHSPRLKNIFPLSLAAAGLLTSHNVTSFFFLPLSTLWALVYIFISSQQKKLDKVKILLVAFSFSAAISAFFILPVIFEKNLVHADSLLGGYFDYRAHFVSLFQVFLTSYWSYGSSVLGPTDDFSFFFPVIGLLLSAVSIILVLIKHPSKKVTGFILTSSLLVLISTFMAHSKSSFIWQMIPFLAYLQFPWRFLTAANFFVALVATASVAFIKGKSQVYTSIILIALIFFFNASFFRPQGWFDISLAEKFSGTSYQKQATISIFDYLPKVATLPPPNPAPYLPYATEGKVSIVNYQHDTNSFNFSTLTSADSIIQIPQYEFPGWQVYLNGKKINHYPQGELGLITFTLPQGEHQISAVFKNTPVRNIGNLITLLSLGYLVYFYATKNKYAK